MNIDMSWWPVLEVPFPMTEGLVLDLTWLDRVLRTAGAAVGPLLLLVGLFFAVRSLFVGWKGE